jgi:uncharacterized protein YcfL
MKSVANLLLYIALVVSLLLCVNCKSKYKTPKYSNSCLITLKTKLN